MRGTPKAIVLDLGNVVLGIDFRRVFRSWAQSAGIEEDVFYERWSMDAPYEAQEIGAMNFSAYTRHLSALFEIDLTVEQWCRGWNDLFTGPFASVVAQLPALAERYPLYAFTNTNHTHSRSWREQFPGSLTSFHHVFESCQIGARKPDVTAFEYVCNEIGQRPADVLFLDDNHDNIQGALRAGLDAHLVAGEQAVSEHLRALACPTS